jgi:hypothetical protein
MKGSVFRHAVKLTFIQVKVVPPFHRSNVSEPIPIFTICLFEKNINQLTTCEQPRDFVPLQHVAWRKDLLSRGQAKMH